MNVKYLNYGDVATAVNEKWANIWGMKNVVFGEIWGIELTRYPVDCS